MLSFHSLPSSSSCFVEQCYDSLSGGFYGYIYDNSLQVVVSNWFVFDGGYIYVYIMLLLLEDSGRETHRRKRFRTTNFFAIYVSVGEVGNDKKIQLPWHGWMLLLCSQMAIRNIGGKKKRFTTGFSVNLAVVPVKQYRGRRWIFKDFQSGVPWRRRRREKKKNDPNKKRIQIRLVVTSFKW